MLGRPPVEIVILFVANILEEVAVLLGDFVILDGPDLQHWIFNEVVVDDQLIDQVVQVEAKAKNEGNKTSGRGDVEVEQLKDKPKSQIEDGDLVKTVEERVQLGDSALLYFVLKEPGEENEDPAEGDDEHLHIAVVDEEGSEARPIEPPVHFVQLEGLSFVQES